MSAFMVIAIGLTAGLLFKRFTDFPDNTADVLNRYVIWVALPGLILSTVPKLTLSSSALIPMAVAWLMLLVSAASVWAMCRWFNWSRSTRCVLLLLVPLGNTSFVGIPLVAALIGDDAVLYAILYDQLGSFLALATYGPLVLAMHSDSAFSVRSISQKIITFPPFIALLMAVVLSLTVLNEELQQTFNVFGATLVPVVMVAVGYQWQFKLPREDRAPIVFGLVFKLLLAPMLVWLMLLPFSMPEIIRHTVILEAGMASMVSAAALAISQQQNPKLASALVGYGILLSLATVPLWYQFIQP